MKISHDRPRGGVKLPVSTFFSELETIIRESGASGVIDIRNPRIDPSNGESVLQDVTMHEPIPPGIKLTAAYTIETTVGAYFAPQVQQAAWYAPNGYTVQIQVRDHLLFEFKAHDFSRKMRGDIKIWYPHEFQFKRPDDVHEEVEKYIGPIIQRYHVQAHQPVRAFFPKGDEYKLVQCSPMGKDNIVQAHAHLLPVLADLSAQYENTLRNPIPL